MFDHPAWLLVELSAIPKRMRQKDGSIHPSTILPEWLTPPVLGLQSSFAAKGANGLEAFLLRVWSVPLSLYGCGTARKFTQPGHDLYNRTRSLRPCALPGPPPRPSTAERSPRPKNPLQPRRFLALSAVRPLGPHGGEGRTSGGCRRARARRGGGLGRFLEAPEEEVGRFVP